MASNKTVNIESFFQALSSDSYAPLNQLLDAHGPKEMSSIANSCNSEGETPLIVAIKGNLYSIVECLVETLKASTCQLGRFIWKGLDYPQVPPLLGVDKMRTRTVDRGPTKMWTFARGLLPLGPLYSKLTSPLCMTKKWTHNKI